MRKLKYIKLFENFLTKIDIKKGDKVTIKKEKLLDGVKSDLDVGVEYTGFLKDNIERNKPIILIDDKGNKIMNTSPITKFHNEKSLVMTNTSIYSIKKKENINKSNTISLINTPTEYIISELNKLKNLSDKLMWLYNNNLISVIPAKCTDSNQDGLLLDYSGRVFILVKIGKYNIPFYISTGKAGKKNVQPGKWYATFGIGKEGWINKGSEEEINDNYGNKLLQKISKILNDCLGTIKGGEEKDGKMVAGMRTLSFYNIDCFNRQMNLPTEPAPNNHGDFYSHATNTLKILNNLK
jgi:hypothetical protein